jgi:magnesium-transporting ATPase (P-type)
LAIDRYIHTYVALKTDKKNGIQGGQTDEAARIHAFGSNKKRHSEPPGFWQLFFGALEDFTMRILIVAGFLSIGIEVGTAKPENRGTAWIEGFAVLMAVLICAIVTSVNDYQK